MLPIRNMPDLLLVWTARETGPAIDPWGAAVMRRIVNLSSPICEISLTHQKRTRYRNAKMIR
jgi:hypothetical protein